MPILPRIRLPWPLLPLRQDLCERILLLAWLSMSIALLVYVLRFGHNLPMWEEWYYVPIYYDSSAWLDWIFGRLHEHRFVLGRAVWLLLFHGSGGDFRAGMLLNVVLLSVSAWIWMKGAARLRGKASPVDLLIPALLLNPAGWENLLLGYQVAFTFDLLFVALLAQVALNAMTTPPGRTIWQASLLVSLLSLGGWIGLAFVPMGTLWIAYLCWQAFCAGSRTIAILSILLAIAAGAWFCWCFLEVQANPTIGRTPNGLAVMLRVIAEFLASSLGPMGSRYWPVTGYMAVTIMAILSIALLIKFVRKPRERATLLGWCVILSAVLLMGYGLGKWRPNGFAARNLPLSASLVFLTLYMTIRVGPTLVRWRKVIEIIAIVLCVITLYQGWRDGLRSARQVHEWHKQYERDRESGLPLNYLASRHLLFPHPELPDSLRSLRDHHHPAGKNVPDPAATVSEKLVVPTPTRDPVPGDPAAHAIVGRPKAWHFKLEKPVSVTGIRVQFRYFRTAVRVPIHIIYHSHDSGNANTFTGCYPWLTPYVWTLDFWVDQKIDELWIRTLEEADEMDILGVDLLKQN